MLEIEHLEVAYGEATAVRDVSLRVAEGEIVSAHLMTLNLACDHRILYGADGARFISKVAELLSDSFLFLTEI